MKLLQFFLFCTCCFVITGCSGNIPMSGRVTYSDNGEPVPRGTVVFANATQQARGDLDENGRYVLGFVKENDGLPKGTYQVYIAGTTYYEGTEEDPYQKQFVLVAPKFTDPATSGLTIVVDGSTKKFDIVVERP